MLWKTDQSPAALPVSAPRRTDENFDYEAATPTGETLVVPRAGQRLHAGFLAQEIKAALDAQEMDFGVWGLEDKLDPDSRQWLRPDLQARLAAIESE